MNTQQYDTVISLLTRLLAAVEGGELGGVKDTPPMTPTEVPQSPWESPVPEGYDTVVGFIAKTQPSAFEMFADPATETQHDGFWLKHQASRRGLGVVKVEAPEAFKEMGIEVINAYPLSLLQERLAA